MCVYVCAHSPVHFNAYVESCHHYQNQDTEQLQHPRKKLMSSLCIHMLPSPLALDNQ